MNKIIKRAAIFAAATLACTLPAIPISAHAAPTPTITNPCTKTVADNNIDGHNGIKVADTQGTIHWIYKGYPQRFCPWQAYVPSGGWHIYATSHGYSSTYTTAGWHVFKSSLLDVNYTLYVKQY